MKSLEQSPTKDTMMRSSEFSTKSFKGGVPYNATITSNNNNLTKSNISSPLSIKSREIISRREEQI